MSNFTIPHIQSCNEPLLLDKNLNERGFPMTKKKYLNELKLEIVQ